VSQAGVEFIVNSIIDRAWDSSSIFTVMLSQDDTALVRSAVESCRNGLAAQRKLANEIVSNGNFPLIIVDGELDLLLVSFCMHQCCFSTDCMKVHEN
jgi:hypothetical protein